MNLSIHLPPPLSTELDAYAHQHGASRSSVVREAVAEYLNARSGMAWPKDLARWMRDPARASFEAQEEPDYDAIRREMNASMSDRPVADL
jgi:predicted transcriptional regulator